MTEYTAGWQDKTTAILYKNETPIGSIIFDESKWLLYGNATLTINGETFRAELVKGNNAMIMQGDKEIFTAVFHPLWGNLELHNAGEDMGYDIKGKWFKPGTRLTDAEDNDLVVVTSDPWTGKKMEILAGDEISALMIIATTYFHIRGSAAKTLGVMIGNM